MKLVPLELQGSCSPAQGALGQDRASGLVGQGSEDGISADESFNTQKTTSSTDGIDVLGDAPKPDTFLNWNTSWSERIVEDLRFKRAVMALILLDSAMMGLATLDFVTDSDRVVNIFSNLNMVSLCLFTLELILRIIHRRMNLLSDGWLIFDLVVISCSWLFSLLVVARTFRVIRTLRLATRLKELRNMALVLQEVVPKIMAIAFVLGLSFYIFSIMFTDFYKDLYQQGYTDQDYFSSIDVTAFTLFQIMTLDQWSTITKEVQLAHPMAWVIFIPFVVSSSFFILNLTVAVIYEAVVRVQQRQSGDPIMPDQGLALAGPVGEKASDYLTRLEQKVDSLTTCVELLLRKQMLLQASVSDMSQSAMT